MNRRAKFYVASFTLGGEIRNRTNTQNYRQTVTDIATSCLSACVDKNDWLYAVEVWTGGTYPGTSVTSVLSPAVEASYLRLEILLPVASSAAAMAALKVEFFGSVIADLQTTEDRMTHSIRYVNEYII